jgi:hypothetical protein
MTRKKKGQGEKEKASRSLLFSITSAIKYLGMFQSYVKADSRGVDFVVVQRGFCCPNRDPFRRNGTEPVL